jgi:hypothetical protein
LRSIACGLACLRTEASEVPRTARFHSRPSHMERAMCTRCRAGARDTRCGRRSPLCPPGDFSGLQ